MESLKSDDTYKPNIGLLIVDGIWRNWKLFFGSRLSVMSSAVFDETDYIRDYKDFKLFKNRWAKPELVKTVLKN
jgi:hypothetical protein